MKEFESFRLDTSNQCLWRNGAQIALPPKPFAVLRYLVENPGRLVSHDEMLDALWPETYVQPQVLRTYVLDLRKVLGDDAGRPRFIQTLPKRGYCFVAQVLERAGSETCTAKTTASEAPVAGILELTGIIGREEELAMLQTQLDVLAGGQRRVVFVCGEAGIGKTAVVDAFCRQVESSLAATVARGQCVQGISAREDYYPVMEALSQLCAGQDGEIACRILARMAPAWLAQGREARDEASAVARPPAQERPPVHERLLGDLCGALEELSANKPLILLFEDIEWADEATLNLISALARRRAPARLMVLATCRPLKGFLKGSAERPLARHPLKELKQDLLIRRLCTEVLLAPLKKTAVKGLLSRELEQEALPPGIADFVHRRAEGNPLFVFAILEHLISERVLVRKGTNGAARWDQAVPLAEIEAGVPGELAQMIELEIERLGPEDQFILEAGSLMNVAFPAWAVAAALGKDAGETEEACDELARRLYFVERAGEDELPDGTRSPFYVFAHGLYREAIYRRQPATRRGKRHIRIAERLRELFAGHEADVAREMAMHFEAGGDWPRAASALRLAACRALERRAFADAAELLEHALSMVKNLSEVDRRVAEEQIRRELGIAREAVNQGLHQESLTAKA
jgi:predicted ATPase/DNA-binding winged helix-turn-helix (wHTH) protein